MEINYLYHMQNKQIKINRVPTPDEKSDQVKE